MEALKEYREDPTSLPSQRKLRGLLWRGSPFAAFKRCYVRQHLEDFPGLADYLS